MPRKNKIESALSVEQLSSFLQELASMPSPTLAKIQALVAEKFGVDVSLEGARTFRDKTYDAYLQRLEAASRLAQAVAEARKSNPGVTLADAAADLLAQSLFEVLNQPGIAEKIADLRPSQIAAMIRGLRAEDRKLEALRLEYQKYQDKVKASRETIEKALKKEEKRGGISPETLKEIEQSLNLL